MDTSTERFTILRSVYEALLVAFDRNDREQGGVLGAGADGVICRYHHDLTGSTTQGGYQPDVRSINRVLSEEWRPVGVYMHGIIHSHTNGNGVLSCGDIAYGMRILQAIDVVDRFWLPILYRTEQGEQRLSCYSVSRDGSCRLHEIVLIEDTDHAHACLE